MSVSTSAAYVDTLMGGPRRRTQVIVSIPIALALNLGTVEVTAAESALTLLRDKVRVPSAAQGACAQRSAHGSTDVLPPSATLHTHGAQVYMSVDGTRS